MAEGRENDFQIYSSMTKQKEKFNPITPGKAVMYVCGVISYDFSHIGHARAYVAFDFLFRYLKYLGYEVKYVRNFTDVDDKDWGFFVPYLIGSIFLVVLAVGSISPGTSDGGLALSQNVCFMQQNQELSIQNEHSPALPGYKEDFNGIFSKTLLSHLGTYEVAKWNGTKVYVRILDRDSYSDPESIYLQKKGRLSPSKAVRFDIGIARQVNRCF
ncbi:hypothetical protein L2E82_40565 [Cichorium intybus]|uniref:Uncharacterized protein n=1 Tax=Cichorium intybus TaxID=13427 RepID=A0ACB9AMP0_CICIN|nr:hypothetical protein L2E82_40565 [Cichorium intybus]